MKRFIFIIVLIFYGVDVFAVLLRDATVEIVTDSTSSLQWQDNNMAKTTQKNWNEAVNYCEDLSFGGYDDWRLPSVDELQTLNDFSKYNPVVSTVFVNVTSSYYWSSTTETYFVTYAWLVDLDDGYTDYDDKLDSHYVRCVRGGFYNGFDSLADLKKAGVTRDTAKQIVTDAKSGLSWQDDSLAKTGQKNWNDAVNYCDNLSWSGYSDWRLPSVDELQTLNDFSKYDSSLNSSIINTALGSYWSSTSYSDYVDGAWIVNAEDGYTNGVLKSNSNYIRCVRGGQFGDRYIDLLYKNTMNCYDVLTSKIDGIISSTSWNLLGACKDISVSDLVARKPNTQIIWIYDRKMWKAYSPIKTIRDKIILNTSIGVFDNIPAGFGFWVK